MKHFQLKRSRWHWLTVWSILLLACPALIQAQTFQTNYGTPSQVDVANGVSTFKIRIIGAAKTCAAATLDLSLPPGYVYVSGSAMLDASITGSSGIVTDTSTATAGRTRKIWLNQIPAYPGVTEISYQAYASCAAIGANDPNINYTLKGCSGTPETMSTGVVTRNAQINIINITNNNVSGPVDTVYSRKITLRNDGYGAIDTFYLDSRNQSGLQIQGFTADAGAIVSQSTFIEGGETVYRYKIIKTSSLNNTDSFSITEQVKIANCSGPYQSNLTSWYGINGIACSSMSNSTTAGALLANGTSSLAISRIGTFRPGCRGSEVTDTLVLWNNGQTSIVQPDVALSGYNSNSGNIFSWTTASSQGLSSSSNYLINRGTIQYKIKQNGVWQSAFSSLTVDSSLSANSTGIANSCFGVNDKIAVWAHLPFTLNPGDSVLYIIKGKQCAYNTCNEDVTATTRLDARFRSACGTLTYAAGGGTSYAGQLNLVPTDFPIEVVPGQNLSLGYYVPSTGNFASQLYAGGSISFSVQLPPQFNWTGNSADLSFFKGATNIAGTVTYSGNPGGIITFTFPPNTTSNYYVGSVLQIKNVTVDNTLSASVSATVSNATTASRQAQCTPSKLDCADKTINIIAGPGNCTNGGISTGRIIARRTNYGAGDAQNNGTINGALDMTKVKTQYVMTGDTLEVSYSGKVKLTPGSPVFAYGGVNSTFSGYLDKLQPFKSTVSLYNSSAAQIGVNAQKSLNFGSGSTANATTVTFAVSDFNAPTRTALQDGDSIVVKKYFRILAQNAVTDNDNSDFIGQVIIGNNDVYISDQTGPNAVKYMCGNPLRQWFNMVSLRVAPSESGSRTIAACADLDYTLRLNAYVGGNGAPFLFEYRKVLEVTKVTYAYPQGLSYGGTTSGATAQDPSQNPLVFLPPFSNYPTVMDESRINQTLVKPSLHISSCSTQMPLGNIISSIEYKKYPDMATVRTIPLTNTVASITKPDLTMTSPLAQAYSSSDSISWVVRIGATGASSSNTYLGKQSGIGSVNIYKIQKIANATASSGTDLVASGGVFQAGTINNNAANFYRVFATYSSCEKDTLVLAYGWDCASYPASIADATCKKAFGLSVTALQPALQLTTINPASTAKTYSLCDTLEYEIEVTNSGLGVLDELSILAQLPLSGGLQYVPGSFQLKYPSTLAAYSRITDDFVRDSGNALLAFHIPVANLRYLYTAGKYRIKFKVTFTSCDYVSGSRITFLPTGQKACGTVISGTGQSSNRIVLSAAPASIPSFTFSSSVDSIVACNSGGTTTTYRFKLTNNTNTTTNKDGFRITLPPSWSMATNTLSFEGGNPTGASLDAALPNGIYDFNIGAGLASGQSIAFTATLSNNAFVACGKIDSLKEVGFVKFDAVCVAKNLNCTIKQLHENEHATSIKVLRPSYSISGFNAQQGSLPNHLTGSVTLQNNNNIFQNQNGTLKIYKDVNANGIRDNSDTLMGSQTFALAQLASQTFNYDFTGYLGQACPMIAVFEGCYCDTPSFVLNNCNINLEPLADLSLTKTVNNNTPSVGDTITFSIVVANAGPNAANGVTVVDTIPNGYNYVSHAGGNYAPATHLWTIGTIDTGATDTLHIKAIVNASGNYSNTAQVFTANEKDPDSKPGNNNPSEDDQDTATTTPVALADLELSKIVNNTTPYVGDTVSFSITVVNKGPSRATRVTVEDQLPSGYSFVSSPTAGYVSTTGIWTIGNIDSGDRKILTVNARVNGTGDYINKAQVASVTEKDPDSTPGNNNPAEDDQDTAATRPIPLADLELSKIVSTATPYVGDTVAFTLSLVNRGPSKATLVSISDPLPTGYSFVRSAQDYNPANGLWTAGTIDSGAQKDLIIYARVNATGNYLNTAQVASVNEKDPDSTPGNDNPAEDDQDTASTKPMALIDLSLTKTVSNPTPIAGTAVTFTLAVTNDGPSKATGVSVSDQLPSGYSYISHSGGNYNPANGIWDLGNLDSGATTSLAITVMVNESGDYKNIAQVQTANEKDKDSSPGNSDPNEDDQDEEKTVPLPPVADLRITKTDYTDTYTPGTTTTYTVVVHNEGPSRVTHAKVSDLTPQGTGITFWSAVYADGASGNSIGSGSIDETVSMPAGSSITYSVLVGLPSDRTGDLVNIAKVALPQGVTDPTPENNIASDTDRQNSIADVRIRKTGPASVSGNDTLSYLLTITNNGPSDADGTTVKDGMVENFKVTGISCAGTTGYALCPIYYPTTVEELQNGTITISALPSASSITIRVTGVATGTTGSSIVNIASITVPSHIKDVDTSDNTDTAITIIRIPLPVNLKGFTATAEAGKSRLEWSTASETNNKGFDIERSIDGKNWKSIGFVPSIAEHGNSAEELHYKDYDRQPSNGMNYYRLKQEDYDGEFVYSEIRNVSFAQNTPINIYPNPVTDKVYIRLEQWENVKEVRILDVSGRTVYSGKEEEAKEGISMNRWSAGTYMLLVELKDGALSSFKVVKE